MRRQFGRDDRRPCVDLRPRVARDKADDALDLRRIVAGPCVGPALSQPIEPQRPVRIDHDLEHRGVGERFGDAWPHRRAQHRASPLRGNGGGHDRVPRA
jgi:hypothetical protein